MRSVRRTICKKMTEDENCEASAAFFSHARAHGVVQGKTDKGLEKTRKEV